MTNKFPVAKSKTASTHTEDFADKIAEKVVDSLGQERLVKRIRHSQFFSSLLGAAGLALFLVGIEKVFNVLSGWFSIILGLLLLAISGALFKKLN